MIVRSVRAAAVALLFAIVATANSGGYRYGISDQAFYLPALAKSLDPSLYPRDTEVLAAQTRLWVGDDAFGAIFRHAPVGLPVLAAGFYVLGLLLLAGAAVYFARGLRASSLAVTASLAIVTLRHHMPKTGANSLEGYFHPRMIAFALGLWALGYVLRRRFVAAFALVAVAGVVHTTAALWFGGAIAIAAAWQADRRTLWLAAAAIATGAIGFAIAGPRMDSAWLAVLAEKDYLFPSEWPAWAWAINLAYPAVLWAIYRRRVAQAAVAPGEAALVTGLLVLVGGFLVSVPLSAARIALIVQLQITRVFWVLDGVVLLYLMWWLIDDAAARGRRRWRAVAAALVVALAVGRGYYVLVVAGNRPLVTWTFPADAWTDAMTWIRTQPGNLHVLADPGHAWKYGSSVRLAAERDTVLEQTKDTALAMYDRAVAMRVGDRIQALSGFEDFSADQLRSVGARYHADVLVLERTRPLTFPVLYANGRFVVYDLR